MSEHEDRLALMRRWLESDSLDKQIAEYTANQERWGTHIFDIGCPACRDRDRHEFVDALLARLVEERANTDRLVAAIKSSCAHTSPMDCTNHCMSAECNCSGVMRPIYSKAESDALAAHGELVAKRGDA